MAAVAAAPQATSSTDRVDWAGVGLFVLIAYGLAWALEIGGWLLHAPFVVAAAAAMYGPAAACLILRQWRREGWADAGLRLPVAWRYVAYAVVVPPLVLLSGIALSLLIGVQRWDLGAQLQIVLGPAAMRMTGGSAGTGTLFLLFAVEAAAALTILPFVNGLATFGEELGWRGYLLPKLAPLGEPQAALLVGVVWGLWHAPVIWLYSYNYPGHARLGVLAFPFFTVPTGFFIAWLRFRSASIWPGVVAHGAINAQAGLALLLASGADSLLGVPTGLMAVLPWAALAVWLVVSGHVRRRSAAIAFAALLLLSGCAGVGNPISNATASAKGDHFVDLLVAGQWAEAEAEFNSQMHSDLPQSKLSQSWAETISRYGAYGHRISTSVNDDGSIAVVDVLTQFHDRHVDIRVSFDGSGRVAGLYYLPA
jgi:membrane protease YdiL (CAAX protease family)